MPGRLIVSAYKRCFRSGESRRVRPNRSSSKDVRPLMSHGKAERHVEQLGARAEDEVAAPGLDASKCITALRQAARRSGAGDYALRRRAAVRICSARERGTRRQL